MKAVDLKVLVVDDQDSKLNRICTRLLGIGIPRENLHTSKSVQEAKECLSRERYDLLLLDIALPRTRDDPSPNTRAGAELLNELVTRDVLKRPRFIVGVTAHKELHQELEHEFSRRLWTLLYADYASNEWLDRIEELTRYLLSVDEAARATEYKTDLCIVTALHDPELKAVLRLPWNWSTPRVFDPATFVYEGGVQIENRRLSVVASSIGRAGMVPAAILCMKLIHHYRPRFLAMTGICAGRPSTSEIGDVILANTVWDWQSGKNVREDGKPKLLIEPHQLAVPTFISARFDLLKQDAELWSRIRESWPGPKPAHALSLKIGPVSSGSSVSADEGLMDQITEQHRKLLGIEMEVYGVYSAAFYGPYPKPSAFALKSVADFGGEDKNDEWQPYASYTSANALGEFVEKHLTSLLPLAGQH